MQGRLKSILLFISLLSVGALHADYTKREPACHKSYAEHHIGLNYGVGFNLNKGLIHKFALGYQRELVHCNSLIKDPSKNLFWFDLAPGKGNFRKFGYSRTFQLEDYFYYRAPKNFDRKYEFWGKIVHATVLEAGIGRERYEEEFDEGGDDEEDDIKRKTIFRFSPSLDFRFWDRLQVSPYYSMDLSFRKKRFHHEAGIKAYIISELIDAGFDIHGLDSDTYEENEKQQFVMNIKGEARKGLESLSASANKLNNQGLDTAFATDWKLLV